MGRTNFTQYLDDKKYYKDNLKSGDYTIGNLNSDYSDHLVTFKNVQQVVEALNSIYLTGSRPFNSDYLGHSKVDLSKTHINSQHILVPIGPLSFKVKFGYGSYHT